MKHVVLVAALSALSGATTLPSFAAPTSVLAPADRYFGRLHMSILGIGNSLRDLVTLADSHPADPRSIYDKALLVEDALMNWAGQFPRDPWIPKLALGLAQLYGKLDIEAARTRRSIMLDWLSKTYPQSPYAQLPRN